jgi:hypothetical protein
MMRHALTVPGYVESRDTSDDLARSIYSGDIELIEVIK